MEENDISIGLEEFVPPIPTPTDDVDTALIALATYGPELADLGYPVEKQIEFLSNPDNIAFLRIFGRQNRDRIQKALGELSFD